MLSEKLLFALNDMDDGSIEAVGRLMGYERTKAVSRHRKTTRRMLLIAAVVTAFLAFGAAAYAANLFGIREMSRTVSWELPEDAEDLIQQHSESGETEGWSCRITESLCDAATVMVTVTVHVSDRYVVIPTDINPADPAASIGLAENGSLADYAAAQGKTCLMVSAHLSGEGIGEHRNSQRFENISDNEMIIFVQADKTVSAESIDAVCTVSALDSAIENAQPADIQRVEIPLSLTEGASRKSANYAPVDPDAIAGLHFTGATVTETALGISLSLEADALEDETFYRNMMKIDCDEMDFSESSHGLDEDGAWRAQFTQGKGTVHDTLTIYFYDWDKQPIGSVLFRKAEG